jgi:hypothetical protein
MSYISLSSFGSSTLAGRKSREPFRNSRVLHKLRGSNTLQNLEEPQLALRTEPSEPQPEPKSLLDKVRHHFEDDARSEKSHRSIASQKSVKSSFTAMQSRALKHFSIGESANLSQRSFGHIDKEE